MNGRDLSRLYKTAHNRMRDLDGLLPQEAFDELLKFLFYRECIEKGGDTSVAEPILASSGLYRSNQTDDTGTLRRMFSRELSQRAPWASELWHDSAFHLSDEALLELQRIFSEVQLTELPLDIRSTALRTFLTADLRKGLGIYLTPEDVVRMMVDVLEPKPSEVVLDPACGSGTFLMAVAERVTSIHSRGTTPHLYGIDKNPRMLLLADLNLGHSREFEFIRSCEDSLRAFAREDSELLGLAANSVDVILTNPPFGVSVSRDTGLFQSYDAGRVSMANDQDKIPSEMLFLELCLRLLRPGGRLGIVLPRSVLTNERLQPQRESIDKLGHLTHLVDLPQETFAATGTQTTTVAVFFQKHRASRRPKTVTVRVRHLMGVSDAPILRADGSVWQTPGYDNKTRVLFDPPAGIEFPRIDPAPPNGEPDAVEPMDVFELEARMATTLPQGWKLGQVKAEHPSTNHVEFVMSILAEIARCLNMPFNVAAGNSSGYNYASGHPEGRSTTVFG